MNKTGENWRYDYEREVNQWCRIASFFFENRNNYNRLKSTANDKTAVKEYRWPPDSLPVDWFDFEKSFNILSESECGLYEDCNMRGIDYPEKASQEWVPVDFWKVLQKENKIEEGKEYWRTQAEFHLKDLMKIQQDLLFLG